MHSVIPYKFSVMNRSREIVEFVLYPVQDATVVTWKGIHLGAIFPLAGKTYCQSGPVETREEVCCIASALNKLLDRHIDDQIAKIHIPLEDYEIGEALYGRR